MLAAGRAAGARRRRTARRSAASRSSEITAAARARTGAPRDRAARRAATRSSRTSGAARTASSRTGSSAPTGCATTGATRSSRRSLEHIRLDADRDRHRLRDRVRRRARSRTGSAGSRRRSALVAAFLYTIPSLALFQLLVPFTGLTVTTVEIALVSYTLLILFRNTLEGLRGGPARRARGGARDGPDADGRRCSASSCRSRCRRSWPGSGSRP